MKRTRRRSPYRRGPAARCECHPCLFGGGRRNNFRKTGILYQAGEFLVLIDIGNVVVSAFLGSLQAMQTLLGISQSGIDLGQHVVVAGTFLRTADLSGHSAAIILAERLGVELQGPAVFGDSTVYLVLAEPRRSQIDVEHGSSLIQRQRFLEIACRRAIVFLYV